MLSIRKGTRLGSCRDEARENLDELVRWAVGVAFLDQ